MKTLWSGPASQPTPAEPVAVLAGQTDTCSVVTLGERAEPEAGPAPQTSARLTTCSGCRPDTSGGDTDTDVNELATIPTGSPSTSAQTAVTPDGKQPKARRN